jgi:hypothetical protein
MKDLLNDIEKGIEERNKLQKLQKESKYYIADVQGKGSKAYITKRIDLLREKLLEVKKELK